MNGESRVGMHYCNYGPDPAQIFRLIESGMVLGATADDAGAEVLELPTHQFFVLTLFQPQIGALTGKRVHPLLPGVRPVRPRALRTAQVIAGPACPAPTTVTSSPRLMPVTLTPGPSRYVLSNPSALRTVSEISSIASTAPDCHRLS